MKAKSIDEAWDIACEIFPTDYIEDSSRSLAAGYPVYHSTAAGVNAWISDLTDRLEVNMPDGHTINIWIEEPAFNASQVLKNHKALKALGGSGHYIMPYDPESFTLYTFIVGGYDHAPDIERAAYDAIADPNTVDPVFDIAGAYLESKGIQYSQMRDPSVVHYGSNPGHYVLSVYVSTI